MYNIVDFGVAKTVMKLGDKNTQNVIFGGRGNVPVIIKRN